MKRFTKTKEDFTCLNCRATVIGNGYTNHCPTCLHSRHVDINPGDRAETCKGLMTPWAVKKRGSDYYLLHRCLNCGFERINSIAENDDWNVLYEIIKTNPLT